MFGFVPLEDKRSAPIVFSQIYLYYKKSGLKRISPEGESVAAFHDKLEGCIYSGAFLEDIYYINVDEQRWP